MSLKFAECTQCHETHAVRSNGSMSIHQTATGQRCTPPVLVPEPARPPGPSRSTRAAEPPRRPSRRERADAEWEKRRRSAGPVDPELEAAFDLAAEGKKPSQRDQPAAFDRRIYAMGGVHLVRGGLPTLGRSRRGR
jgi:hypothetical protein